MNTAVHETRKNFVKFDDEHFLLYLNEQAAQYTVPESEEKKDGYSYTGPEADGGTLVEAKAVTGDNRRAKFISGLIATKYPLDAQIAVLANGKDTKEHAAELKEFEEFRAECKAAVDELLAR